MPDTRWIKRFLDDNLTLYKQGKANKIEWVGVRFEKQGIICIKFFPPKQIIKKESNG